MIAYYENLKEGAPFFRNHNGEYVAVKSGISKDRQTLYVLTKADYEYTEQENGEYIPVPVAELPGKVPKKDLPYSITGITFEDGLFVHENMEPGFHPKEYLEELFDDYTQEL